MPYISNMDEENQNQNPAQGAVAPAGGGGTHLAPAGGIGSAPGASPTPANTGAGGNFATLQTYLNANQGQAEPLANKITAGIGNQYNTLQGQNQSTLADVNNQVTNAPGYTASNPDVLAQEAANPVSFASDQGNVKNFQSLLNNTYSGPASAESASGYQNQQSAINNAISQGQAATQTEAGRENLLQQNEARPTTGVTALNSAILTQDPNSLSKVQNAYQPFNNLLTGLSSGAQGIDTTIGKEQADAASSSAAANKAIADQSQALQTNLQNEVTQGQTAENTYNQGVNTSNTNLAGFKPIASDINAYNTAYGVSPFAGLAQYLAGPTSLYTNTANPNNVATGQDVAMNNALSTLGGANYSSPITDPTQAGTFAVPTLNEVPAANAAALELQGLTPLTQQFYNSIYKPGNPAYTPNDSVSDMSAALAGEGGSNLNGTGTGQGQAYENLLKQLEGFNNGDISTIPGFSNYYEIA